MSSGPGGRQRCMAQLRQGEVIDLLLKGERPASITRALGVHRSTISRDRAALYRLGRDCGVCPLCGHGLQGGGPVMRVLSAGRRDG